MFESWRTCSGGCACSVTPAEPPKRWAAPRRFRVEALKRVTRIIGRLRCASASVELLAELRSIAAVVPQLEGDELDWGAADQIVPRIEAALEWLARPRLATPSAAASPGR
jgi:hypothetical protein